MHGAVRVVIKSPFLHRVRDTISNSFGPGARVRKKREFSRIQESGRKIYSEYFLLIFCPAEGSSSRLGLTVSRKVNSSSVARNKIKRRIREIFRTERKGLAQPLDIVVIARKDSSNLPAAEFRSAFLSALRKLSGAR